MCTQLAKSVPNVRLAGLIDDAQKLLWLHAVDLAVNPMLVGSGTNIKMFDFMAAGLPVIATPIGARGIASKETSGLRVVEVDAIVSNIAMLLAEPEERRAMGECNRELVEQRFAWERISPRLRISALSVSAAALANMRVSLLRSSPLTAYAIMCLHVIQPKKRPSFHLESSTLALDGITTTMNGRSVTSKATQCLR